MMEKFEKIANEISQHLLGRIKITKFANEDLAVEHVAKDVRQIVDATALLAAKIGDNLELGIMVAALQREAFKMAAKALAEMQSPDVPHDNEGFDDD